MKRLYLTLAILGLIIPYSEFIPFIFENGLNVELILSQMFAPRISSFFSWDVIISAIVLMSFIGFEYKKSGNKKYLWAVLGTCSVGVSFGLPLFLYLKD